MEKRGHVSGIGSIFIIGSFLVSVIITIFIFIIIISIIIPIGGLTETFYEILAREPSRVRLGVVSHKVFFRGETFCGLVSVTFAGRGLAW